MLFLSLLLLVPCYGTGSSSATPVRSSFAGRDTLPLAASERVVFLGVSGDYSGDAQVAVRAQLEGELGLRVVGSPVRSLSEKSRLVWAVRTTEAKSLARQIAKPFKRTGYEVEPLRMTAFSLLGRSTSSTVQRGLRNLERTEDKVWASHHEVKEGVVWTFHEKQLNSSKLLDHLRDADLKASYYHHELELAPGQKANVDDLAREAEKSLDLVRASGREEALILDLYLRDVNNLLALDRGRHTVPCPDVLDVLAKAPQAEWSVTLLSQGYPFQD